MDWLEYLPLSSPCSSYYLSFGVQFATSASCARVAPIKRRKAVKYLNS